MLSKEKTREILNSFSKECYDFWMREGNTKEEAYLNMIHMYLVEVYLM